MREGTVLLRGGAAARGNIFSFISLSKLISKAGITGGSPREREVKIKSLKFSDHKHQVPLFSR